MRMRRLLTVLAVLLVGVAAPASAAPAERTTVPIVITGPDYEHGYVIFLNTSREAFCTQAQIDGERAIYEWLQGGMQGPFPGEELPSTDGFADIEVVFVDSPKGLIAPARASDLHIELWTLDDPEDQLGIGACLDTDDQGELFATGTSTFQGMVNDLGGEGLRPTSIDHVQGRAHVVGTDGTHYRYTWFFHQHVPCVDGPGPRCEVARFDLRLQS